jgi:hypothetical protein
MLLPDLILEEIEDDEGVNNFAEELKCGTVLVQGEDFGGGIGMPHYGSYRPSTDYYNSNLIMNNFVIADIVAAVSRIYFYDERGQDKGANALSECYIIYQNYLWNLALRVQFLFSTIVSDKTSPKC